MQDRDWLRRSAVCFFHDHDANRGYHLGIKHNTLTSIARVQKYICRELVVGKL